jgi:plasmid stabilization system protein ParE
VKLRFTGRALENLLQIADYLQDRNPAAALRVRKAIYESLGTLVAFPYAGRLQTTEGIRKLVTRKYSYLVFYTVDEATAEIVILNVKHPARKPEHGDA